MTKPIRGEAVYEKAKSKNICHGCVWNIGGCLLYKYLKPKFCKSMKEKIRNKPAKHYVTPDREEFSVVKILSYWNYDSGKKEFKYFKVKEVLDCNGWRIVSSREIDLAGYQRFLDKEAREKKKKVPTLLRFIRPLTW